MIIQDIIVHKGYEPPPRPHLHTVPSGYGVPNARNQDAISTVRRAQLHLAIPPVTRNSTKQYYTEWIKTIPFDRGNYVVSKDANPPYNSYNYMRVVSIQEVHYLCGFDDQERPLPMELVNLLGTRFYSRVDLWKRVVAPYQPEWQFDVPPA